MRWSAIGAVVMLTYGCAGSAPAPRPPAPEPEATPPDETVASEPAPPPDEDDYTDDYADEGEGERPPPEEPYAPPPTMRVSATAGQDLKMVYMREYMKLGGSDFTTGIGKKGKITGSVLVVNLLPEPLAEARVVLVITTYGGSVRAPLEARFDPPIAVADLGSAPVKGVANLSDVESLDWGANSSLRVEEARGVARAVSFHGDAGAGDVTAAIDTTALTAQMIYRGVDGDPSTWDSKYAALYESYGATLPDVSHATVEDVLTGTASVTVSNGGASPLVRARVGLVDSGANVSLLDAGHFVVLDPPLGPGETRTLAIAVRATLPLATPSPRWQDGVGTLAAYDALAATDPAPVLLQKATPLLDAPKKGAKLAKLAKGDTVVELGLPKKGMVQVRAGSPEQTGWIKASALDAKVTLPGSKKKAKHKGRVTTTGHYVAACDLAKVKGAKVHVDPDAFVITYDGKTARIFPGAAQAELATGSAMSGMVSIDAPPYGPLECPFVPDGFLKEQLF